jgi:hypothetical protein
VGGFPSSCCMIGYRFAAGLMREGVFNRRSIGLSPHPNVDLL